MLNKDRIFHPILFEQEVPRVGGPELLSGHKTSVMDVTPQDELENLRRRVAELERQLADERSAHTTGPPKDQGERQWRIVDTALSHTPDSTYIFDLQGRVVYANKTLLNLWRKTLDEAVGKDLRQLGYPEEIIQKAQREIRKVIETREPARGDMRLSAFTPSIRHYEYIFVPIFGTEGQIEAIAGSSRDITERQESRTALEKANAALDHARAQLINIFESMTDAFFALDNNWCFTYVNRRAEAVLFRTREELLGKNIWAEFAPAVGSVFYHEYHRAKEEGISVQFEEFYPPLHTWFEVRAYPSQDGLGVYFHNISERKQAQEALQRQSEELSRINADLEHFAYAAAHDLQEPLRMVSIFTQLLKRKYAGRLDPEADEYISQAVGGASHMERLVHDLLAYTRLAANGNGAHEPVNAEMILQKVSSSLQATIQSSGAVVSHDPLPSVLVEEVHLQQLFQNLIGNAIKYRSEDVPRIHVSATRQEPLWRFAVEDNGIGIESQFADQVFGLFKRLHSKDAYEGTGIGLAICQKIVNRYGGRIWVESQPGRGSTFFFTLPG